MALKDANIKELLEILPEEHRKVIGNELARYVRDLFHEAMKDPDTKEEVISMLKGTIEDQVPQYLTHVLESDKVEMAVIDTFSVALADSLRNLGLRNQ